MRRAPAGGAALAVGVLGALACAVGAWAEPAQAVYSYTAAFAFGLSVAAGMLVLLLALELTGGRWIGPVRRQALATAGVIPLLALLFVPLLFGLDALFPWRDPAATLESWVRDLTRLRRGYLETPWFAARAAVYFAVWIAAGRVLYARARRPEREPARRAPAALALAATVFALTFASFDWLMALTPAWGSTIWGVYYLAGGLVGALGLLAALAPRTPAGDRAEPAARGRPAEPHRLALGRALLAALLFWAYIGFSQYLIVWIGNLPSEVIWYLPRVESSWGGLAIALIVGHLALPALALLSWRLKQHRTALAAVGAWLLLFHYLDVYWMVLPTLHPSGLRPHWLDLAALAAVVGLATAFGLRRLERLPAAAAPPMRPDAAREYRTR